MTHPPSPHLPGITGNAKVDALLSRLTLEEKIAMVHGEAEPQTTNQGQQGYLPGIPRLGIPPIRMTDGSPGVVTRRLSTGMTGTMGLAATWSCRDAEDNGIVIGRDARTLGIQVLLEPFINLDRDIGARRTYATFGEDPLLTGQIAAAVIRGIQSQGVMAQAKHLAGYDGAERENVIIDPQTLREIYVAPFADAIEAGVSSIMPAYTKLNGKYCCDSAELLIRILRDELGFEGFVTSDWGAVHDTEYINNGLDMEMPGILAGVMGIVSYFGKEVPPDSAYEAKMPAGAFAGKGGTPEELPFQPPNKPLAQPDQGARSRGMLAALREGRVSEETLTRAVGRILVMMDRFGYLDRAPSQNVGPIATEANAPIVQRTAERAAVLLKNEGSLPLKREDLGALALIGPGAAQTVGYGDPSERGIGFPARQKGVFQALQGMIGSDSGVRLQHAVAFDMTGTPVPAQHFSCGGKPGLLRTDRQGGNTQSDATLDFTAANGRALPAGSAWVWKGALSVPVTGSYLLHLQILGATGSLSLDGKVIADTGNLLGMLLGDTIKPGDHNILPTTDGLDNVRRRVELSAGEHTLEAVATADVSGDPVQVRLNWVTPERQAQDYREAIEAAKKSRAAVVFAWARGIPAFGLPGEQNRLIEDIARVNPNTIVVLNLSQPVAMPWLDRVRSVLVMWYTGDEGGPAAANVLLGRVSPAGRLPFTWPRRLEDCVAHDPRHPERSSTGVNGDVVYSEGIDMGYRWYDRQSIEPLYPFGFGLSYSSFAYARPVLKTRGDVLEVSFGITNTGPCDADEVSQVYLGPAPEAPKGVKMAVKALVGFSRNFIKRGETIEVAVQVPRRRWQSWDAAQNAWITPAGPREILIGASSRDLRLKALFRPELASASG